MYIILNIYIYKYIYIIYVNIIYIYIHTIDLVNISHAIIANEYISVLRDAAATLPSSSSSLSSNGLTNISIAQYTLRFFDVESFLIVD